MSDEQESNVNSQEEQEQDEQNSEEQQDDDEDDQQDDDDQEEGSGDEEGDDQDEDEEQGSGQDDDQEDDEQKQEQEDQEDQKKLPTFKAITNVPPQPQQFKFTSLLSEISSLSSSVDNFIGTLRSSSSGNTRRPYTSNYATQQINYQPQHFLQIKLPQPPAQTKVVMMKDEDTQVDMKPQIVIQPVKHAKEENVVQAKPYKISTESENFLSQMYEDNKKLKRWQVNPNNNAMSSFAGSFAGSNGFASGSGKAFYGSKDRFERKEYEKGLFNVDERNREIDEAIMMLKREEEDEY